MGPYLLPSAAIDSVDAAVEDFSAIVTAFYGEMLVGHVQLFTEAAHSVWQSPKLHITEGQAAVTSGYIEARIDFMVRMYIAGRADYFYYHPIENPIKPNNPMESWGENLGRLEIGLGYRVSREMRIKLVYQHNDYADRVTADDPKVLVFQTHVVF